MRPRARSGARLRPDAAGGAYHGGGGGGAQARGSGLAGGVGRGIGGGGGVRGCSAMGLTVSDALSDATPSAAIGGQRSHGP